MTQLTNDEIVEVLKLTAFYDTEDIWWRLKEDDRSILQLFVNCSDLFFWGCSDCEEITVETLPILKQVYEDYSKIDLDRNYCDVASLFACRVRQMRPQGAMYKYIDKKIWYLFDACGPLRETGIGNPKKHPSEDVQTTDTKV